ncbi:LuxR C-terminal-related transcriptional regulator [Streptomyces sp. enrichment culture]|uniref:LuxR C-terminal-related transcriptional regulator n=1 Tax=Streptomyces sp. enrichment culture TaxID=1795815 RepID=UPI003F562FBC
MILRDPSTVDFIAGTFGRLWSQAADFPVRMGRRQAIAASEAMKSDIVRLLIDGEDDKAIARRMAMSVRTCQRHINEMMKRLGARSRVRAGYLLHQYETRHPCGGSAHADRRPADEDMPGKKG